MGNGKQYLLSFTAFFHTGKQYSISYNLHQRIATQNKYPYMFDPWSRFQALKMDELKHGMKRRAKYSKLYPLHKLGILTDVEGELERAPLHSKGIQIEADNHEYMSMGEPIRTSEIEEVVEPFHRYLYGIDEQQISGLNLEKEKVYDLENLNLSSSEPNIQEVNIDRILFQNKKELILQANFNKSLSAEKLTSDMLSVELNEAQALSLQDIERLSDEYANVINHEFTHLESSPSTLRDSAGQMQEEILVPENEHIEYVNIEEKISMHLNEENNFIVADELLTDSSRLLQIMYGTEVLEQIHSKIRDVVTSLEKDDLAQNVLDSEGKVEETTLTDKQQVDNEAILFGQDDLLQVNMEQGRREAEMHSYQEGSINNGREAVHSEEYIPLQRSATIETESILSEMFEKANDLSPFMIDVSQDFIQADVNSKRDVVIHSHDFTESSSQLGVDLIDDDQARASSTVETSYSTVEMVNKHTDQILSVELHNHEDMNSRHPVELSNHDLSTNIFSQPFHLEKVEESTSDKFYGQDFYLADHELADHAGIESLGLSNESSKGTVTLASDVNLFQKIDQAENWHIDDLGEFSIERAQSSDSSYEIVNELPMERAQSSDSSYEIVNELPMERAQSSDSSYEIVNELPMERAQSSDSSYEIVNELPMERAQSSDSSYEIVDELPIERAQSSDSSYEMVNELPIERAQSSNSSYEMVNELPIEGALSSDSSHEIVNELPIERAQSSDSSYEIVNELPLERAQSSDSSYEIVNELPIERAQGNDRSYEIVNELPLERAQSSDSSYEIVDELPVETGENFGRVIEATDIRIEAGDSESQRYDVTLSQFEAFENKESYREGKLEQVEDFSMDQSQVDSYISSFDYADLASTIAETDEVSLDSSNLSTISSELNVADLENGSFDDRYTDTKLNKLDQSYFSDLNNQGHIEFSEISEISNLTNEVHSLDINQAHGPFDNQMASMTEEDHASRVSDTNMVDLIEEITSTSHKNGEIALIDEENMGSIVWNNSSVLPLEEEESYKAFETKSLISEDETGMRKKRERKITLTEDNKGVWKKARLIRPPAEDDEGIGRLPDPDRPPVDPKDKKKSWLIMGKPYPGWNGWNPKKTR